MSSQIPPPTTAGITPERFSETLFFARDSRIAIVILTIFMAVGFGLRVHDLGAESFGEDELNKLRTVEEYRANGLSGKNGEHPFLMKGLQTLSIAAAERVNAAMLVNGPMISDEAAIRFPIALFGTFSSLLIFLLASELFGRSVGLISGVFWAVEPMAIGFDRIAKEDSLVLFFFLLTNLFLIRSQTGAERGEEKWLWKAWAAAIGFAALMASKYYPHLLAISGAYYHVFKNVPGKRWNMEAKRWLIFFAVMGVAFLFLNPTILLPETWREILKFSGENRIGHDSYEFMGVLYRNQMTAWLSGVPWTFYYVFIAVKASTATLLLALIGLPLLFRRQMGDGRYFLFFWAFMWFLPFTFLGGKFTRYFTLVEPLLLISAAVALIWMTTRISARLPTRRWAIAFHVAALAVVVAFPLWNSLQAAPHFRLFTNSLGGGRSAAGSYFPHDEFYDASSRDVVGKIAEMIQAPATIATETPELYRYYAGKLGRDGLRFVSLSDRESVGQLTSGDLIVLARGRRYFSNDAFWIDLHEEGGRLVAATDLAGIPSTRIYQIDSNKKRTK
ncbi:MAG: glycosyltransferase family 39 protein [Pyrinomonadaceae bacterium]